MLSYVALGLLVFVGLVLFYGIIAIHDIPYDIAIGCDYLTGLGRRDKSAARFFEISDILERQALSQFCLQRRGKVAGSDALGIKMLLGRHLEH